MSLLQAGGTDNYGLENALSVLATEETLRAVLAALQANASITMAQRFYAENPGYVFIVVGPYLSGNPTLPGPTSQELIAIYTSQGIPLSNIDWQSNGLVDTGVLNVSGTFPALQSISNTILGTIGLVGTQIGLFPAIQSISSSILGTVGLSGLQSAIFSALQSFSTPTMGTVGLVGSQAGVFSALQSFSTPNMGNIGLAVSSAGTGLFPAIQSISTVVPGTQALVGNQSGLFPALQSISTPTLVSVGLGGVQSGLFPALQSISASILGTIRLNGISGSGYSITLNVLTGTPTGAITVNGTAIESVSGYTTVSPPTGCKGKLVLSSKTALGVTLLGGGGGGGAFNYVFKLLFILVKNIFLF